MQPPSSAAALQTLTDFNTNRKSAADINTQAQAQYGVPDSSARLSTIRGLVGNLQSSVNAVDPSVTGRTTGSFVTEGQRQALVSKERTPILGQLSDENTALGNEQQNFNTSSSLAAQLAAATLSQDQTKYQSLLDQYNAATAAEQEAEKKREFDATLAQQTAAAKASSAGAGSYNLGSLLGGNSTPATPATPAASPAVNQNQQAAYNNLANITKNLGFNLNGFNEKSLSQKQLQALASDYNATLKSANYGNVVDKEKILLYHSLFPSISSSVPVAVLANGSSLRY